MYMPDRRSMPPRVLPLIARDLLIVLYFRLKLSVGDVADLTRTNVRLVRDSLERHGLRLRSRSEAALGRPKSSQACEKLRLFRTGYKDSEDVRLRKAKILDKSRGWNKGLTAATDPRIARNRDSVAKTVSTPEFRERLSQRAALWYIDGTHWRKGVYNSLRNGPVPYLSDWELRRFQELDGDPRVVSWTYEPGPIIYEFEGGRHRYFPDLFIAYADGGLVLEEIKPPDIARRALEGHHGYARLRAKLLAGETYAKQNGWVWQIRYFGKEGVPSTTF